LTTFLLEVNLPAANSFITLLIFFWAGVFISTQSQKMLKQSPQHL
jgi:hypothetical protein